MISRKFRFHGYGSVNSVYRRGRSFRAPYIAVKYADNKKGSPRFAVVVSKKVDKSAVVRNRIRRRIYEQVRKSQPKTGVDIVITVFDAVLATIPDKQLSQIMQNVIKKTTSKPDQRY